jgi:thioredoxin-related protein
MINESFKVIELHAFARKCQYTNQMFRDVKNKSRYREAIEASASDNEKINLLADQLNTQLDESFRQQTLAFRVIIAS